MKLEGVIAKRADAPYVSRAHRDLAEAEVRAAPGVRGLRLHRPQRRARRGRQPAARLPTRTASCVYAGNVGTGWDATTGREPASSAWPRSRSTTPTLDRRDASSPAAGRGAAAGGERWVKPELVAEVAFSRMDARRPGPPCRRSGACAPTSRRARSRARAAAGRRCRRRADGRCDAPAAPSTASRSRNPDRVIDPSHRPDQARPGALLRERRRVDAAAPEGPAGVAGARARRHHRRAVLPEARRDAACRA